MILDKIKLCRDPGKSRDKTIIPRESWDAKFTGNEKPYFLLFWALTSGEAGADNEFKGCNKI